MQRAKRPAGNKEGKQSGGEEIKRVKEGGNWDIGRTKSFPALHLTCKTPVAFPQRLCLDGVKKGAKSHITHCSTL